MAKIVGRENRVQKKWRSQGERDGVRLVDTREKAVGTEPGPGAGEGLERSSAPTLYARNMHYRAGELSQVGQVCSDASGPRQRNPYQGKF